MLRALGEYEVTELKTLIPFHQALLATEQWARGETCRDLVEDKGWLKQLAFPKPEASVGGLRGWRREGRPRTTPSRSPAGASRSRSSGRRPPPAWRTARPPRPALPSPSAASAAAPARAGGGGADALVSPIQGTVWKVAVKQGDPVDEGALIAVIEAMKMENEITAHKAGTVAELPISVGASVASGDTLAVIN